MISTEMDNEVFVEKRCFRLWKANDFGFHCNDCCLQDFIVICGDCFDKSKHFGHNVETIICESGIGCDCGNDQRMNSNGFCDKHSVQIHSKAFNRTRNRSLKSTGSMKLRKISENFNFKKENEGFFDGFLNHLFTVKPLDLPEFYDLNKVSKYSLDGQLLTKYFDRSKAHYLEDELKLKRIYEINKTSNKYPDSFDVTKKRLLLWYSMDNKKGNESLDKLLNNGISYENGKIGRALYFRDRIKRFIKYDGKEFGILLLCEVVVGNVYSLYESKHFREIPDGFDCLKCVGKYTPDQNKHKSVGTGITVPIGKTKFNEDIENKTEFDINQFIVFDKTQVIIRYLVQYYEHKGH